jgi:hypothetical protein
MRALERVLGTAEEGATRRAALAAAEAGLCDADAGGTAGLRLELLGEEAGPADTSGGAEWFAGLCALSEGCIVGAATATPFWTNLSFSLFSFMLLAQHSLISGCFFAKASMRCRTNSSRSICVMLGLRAGSSESIMAMRARRWSE